MAWFDTTWLNRVKIIVDKKVDDKLTFFINIDHLSVSKDTNIYIYYKKVKH